MTNYGKVDQYAGTGEVNSASVRKHDGSEIRWSRAIAINEQTSDRVESAVKQWE
jgi:hypothetical protein